MSVLYGQQLLVHSLLA